MTLELSSYPPICARRAYVLKVGDQIGSCKATQRPSPTTKPRILAAGLPPRYCIPKGWFMTRFVAGILIFGTACVPEFEDRGTPCMKGDFEVGEPIRPFCLDDQEGNLFTPEDARGELIFLDISTMWCAPCRELGETARSPRMSTRQRASCTSPCCKRMWTGAHPRPTTGTAGRGHIQHTGAG